MSSGADKGYSSEELFAATGAEGVGAEVEGTPRPTPGDVPKSRSASACARRCDKDEGRAGGMGVEFDRDLVLALSGKRCEFGGCVTSKYDSCSSATGGGSAAELLLLEAKPPDFSSSASDDVAGFLGDALRCFVDEEVVLVQSSTSSM